MPARVNAGSTPVCLWGDTDPFCIKIKLLFTTEKTSARSSSQLIRLFTLKGFGICCKSRAPETFDDVNNSPGVSGPATEHRFTRVMQDYVLILSFARPLVFNDVYLKERCILEREVSWNICCALCLSAALDLAMHQSLKRSHYSPVKMKLL